MISPKDLQRLHKAKASSEYRSLKTTAQKAELLHYKYSFKRSQLLRLNLCTPKIWRNMVRAHKSKRQCGLNGRPPYLTPENERMLVDELLISATEQEPVRLSNVNQIV